MPPVAAVTALCDVEHLETLGKSLYELLREQVATDVTLVIGTEKFKVHGVVLCAASPYFSRLLTGNFKEKTTGIIDAADDADNAINITLCGSSEGEESEIFQMILQFLYTGTVTDLAQCPNICFLLRVADQLCIRRLVIYVSNFILDGHIDKDNVRDLLLLAGQVCFLESLLSVPCAQFVVSNLHELLDKDLRFFYGFNAEQVYDITAKALCVDPDRIHQLWDAVRTWFASSYELFSPPLTQTPSCIYGRLMSKKHASFGASTTSTFFDFLITGISSTAETEKRGWTSNTFKVGGSVWKISIERAGEHYGAFLYLVEDADVRNKKRPLNIASTASFSIAVVDNNQRHEFFRLQPCTFLKGGPGRGIYKGVLISLVEGFMHQGEVLFQVDVRVDPIAQLCISVSILKFDLSDAVKMLLYGDTHHHMLKLLLAVISSDSLGIESEEELLGIIAETEMQENVREGIVTAIRLHDVPFSRLRSIVQSSPRLQQSVAFKDLLKKTITEEVFQNTSASPSPQKAPPRGLHPHTIQPNDTMSVDALVEWIMAAMAPHTTTTSQSQEEVVVYKSMKKKRRNRRAAMSGKDATHVSAAA